MMSISAHCTLLNKSTDQTMKIKSSFIPANYHWYYKIYIHILCNSKIDKNELMRIQHMFSPSRFPFLGIFILLFMHYKKGIYNISAHMALVS